MVDYEKQTLLGAEPTVQNGYTNYNAGPRKATDKIWGIAFGMFILAYVAWSGARIGRHGSSNTVFQWEYRDNEWELPSNPQPGMACVRIPDADVTTTTTVAPIELNSTKCETAIIEMIATPLIVGIAGGIGFGALIIVGFKVHPYALSYFAVIVQILLPSALAIYLMVQAKSFENAQTDAYENDDTDVESGFTYPAYFLFGVSAILAIIYWFARQSIKLVAELLRFSSEVLQDNMCLIPLKAALCFVFSILYMCLVGMAVVSYMTVDVIVEEQTVVFEDTYDCTPSLEWDTGAQVYSVFFAFVVGWFSFYALETRNYIVGDVTAHWYYHSKGFGDIGRAVKHAFCSHFGSMAFAGLATWFIETLKRHANRKTAHPLLCILGLIARCILSYIEYLFKMAVLMVAITGNSFGSSGIEVGRLFWTSFGNMYHSTGVWYLPGRILGALSFFISAVVGAGYGVGQYYWTKKDCEDHLLDCLLLGEDSLDCKWLATLWGIFAGLGVFLMVLFPLSFLCNMLITIADTAFLCFLMDKRDNVVTKPEFHNIYGQVLAHKNKYNSKAIKAASTAPPSYLQGVPPGYAAAVSDTPPQYTQPAHSQQTYTQNPNYSVA